MDREFGTCMFLHRSYVKGGEMEWDHIKKYKNTIFAICLGNV